MNTNVASTSDENPDQSSSDLDHLRNSIGFPNRDGQFVLLLLRAIRTMWDNERLHKEPFQPERQEVFKFIQKEHYLELQQEDWKPFPSAELNGGKEPRWQTVISWARDHSVKLGYLKKKETGIWWPTKLGLNCPINARKLFESGEWYVGEAPWWSPTLKSLFDPTYRLSPSDVPRPQIVYKDFLPKYQRSVGGRDTRKVLHGYDAIIENVQTKWDAVKPERRQLFIAKYTLDLETAATTSAVICAIESKYRPPVMIDFDEFL